MVYFASQTEEHRKKIFYYMLHNLVLREVENYLKLQFVTLFRKRRKPSLLITYQSFMILCGGKLSRFVAAHYLKIKVNFHKMQHS